MRRRDFLRTGAIAFAAPAIQRGRYRLFAASQREYSGRAIDLVRRSMVIDMLSPIAISSSQASRWLNNPATFNARDLQEHKDSGINAINIAIGLGGPDAYLNTLKYMAGWDSFLAFHGDTLKRINSAADLQRAKDSGKPGIILGLQNSEQFRTADDVDSFYALGLRVSQLTYNARNLIGNGSTERRDDGISDFGARIIQRMNKAGMAVDVSHCGDRTTLDAFEMSGKPVLITHSNCRALANGHPRCKTDEAIQKMAAKGGVMGITGVRMFVKADEPTTVEDVLNHFDHVAKLVGPQHLGVGSDIDLHGYDAMPAEENKALRASYKGAYGFREKIDIEGLNHPKRTFDLTEGLIRRKYSDRDIEGILGGNFQRVLGQIWV